MPYVPNLYSYSNEIPAMLLRAAENRAASQRESGERWGNTIAGLGHIAGQAIGDYQQQKREEPQRRAEEERRARRDKAEQLQAENLQREEAKRVRREEALQMPHRQEALEFLKSDPDGQKAAIESFNAIDDYQDSILGEAAAGVVRSNFNPAVVKVALAELGTKGVPPEKLQQWQAAAQGSPEEGRALVYSLLSNSPEAKHQAIFKQVQDQKAKESELAFEREKAGMARSDREADNTRAAGIAAETARHNRAMEDKESRGQYQVIDGTPSIIGKDGVARPVTNAEGQPVMNSSQPSNSSVFISQPGYAKLTMKQKGQADALNALVASIDDYRKLIDTTSGETGINLFGSDSAELASAVNGILFSAAQAEGTGALQKADREVIEQMIPNGTTFGGAAEAARKGGKAGMFKALDSQRGKYARNLAAYGLQPVRSDELPKGNTAPLQPGTRVSAPAKRANPFRK